MNFKGLRTMLPLLMKHKVPAFLWGSQGVGKTSAIKQMAQEMGVGLRVIYAGTQADPGDLIGLLHKDEENGTVSHLPPSWFPKEGECEKKGIIFLDELNRANPEVIQALFSFVQKGVLHTHVLPEGWYVMGAGNYNSDRFTVTDTSDAAWLSRFCHMDFTPSVEEWLIFEEGRGHHSVADFIRSNTSMLELSAKEGGRLDTSFIVPDRRAWDEQVGVLESDSAFVSMDEGIRFEILSGCVGTAPAAAYVSWLKNAEREVSLKDILTKYTIRGNDVKKRVRKFTENAQEVRFDILNRPIDELFARLDDDKEYLKGKDYLENLKGYLLDIPKEVAMKALTRMSEMKRFYGRDEIANDATYLKKLLK